MTTTHLKKGVTEPVFQRAFQYWKNIDKEISDPIEKGASQADQVKNSRRRDA
ncbi:MAG: hypothetical protein ACLFPI_02495 [Desulfobacterales bacterium]